MQKLINKEKNNKKLRNEEIKEKKSMPNSIQLQSVKELIQYYQYITDLFKPMQIQYNPYSLQLQSENQLVICPFVFNLLHEFQWEQQERQQQIKKQADIYKKTKSASELEELMKNAQVQTLTELSELHVQKNYRSKFILIFSDQQKLNKIGLNIFNNLVEDDLQRFWLCQGKFHFKKICKGIQWKDSVEDIKKQQQNYHLCGQNFLHYKNMMIDRTTDIQKYKQLNKADKIIQNIQNCQGMCYLLGMQEYCIGNYYGFYNKQKNLQLFYPIIIQQQILAQNYKFEQDMIRLDFQKLLALSSILEPFQTFEKTQNLDHITNNPTSYNTLIKGLLNINQQKYKFSAYLMYVIPYIYDFCEISIKTHDMNQFMQIFDMIDPLQFYGTVYELEQIKNQKLYRFYLFFYPNQYQIIQDYSLGDISQKEFIMKQRILYKLICLLSLKIIQTDVFDHVYDNVFSDNDKQFNQQLRLQLIDKEILYKTVEFHQFGYILQFSDDKKLVDYCMYDLDHNNTFQIYQKTKFEHKCALIDKQQQEHIQKRYNISIYKNEQYEQRNSFIKQLHVVTINDNIVVLYIDHENHMQIAQKCIDYDNDCETDSEDEYQVEEILIRYCINLNMINEIFHKDLYEYLYENKQLLKCKDKYSLNNIAFLLNTYYYDQSDICSDQAFDMFLDANNELIEYENSDLIQFPHKDLYPILYIKKQQHVQNMYLLTKNLQQYIDQPLMFDLKNQHIDNCLYQQRKICRFGNICINQQCIQQKCHQCIQYDKCSKCVQKGMQKINKKCYYNTIGQICQNIGCVYCHCRN